MKLILLIVVLLSQDIFASTTFTDESCFVLDRNVITKYACDNIVDVKIPPTIGGETVRKIADLAFLGKRLNSAIIPEGVTSIGMLAFSGNKLNSVVLPKS